MIFKTRKKREVFIRTIDLGTIEESERESLCQKLYEYSFRNTLEITPEYLLKRLKNYNILCLASAGENIIGFGFADYRKLSMGLFKNIPLIHFGLTIIDKEWRGDRVSRLISKCTVKFVIKKNGFKIFLTGFAISAKCSSPVSFYRLQQASLKIGFPKFDAKGELHFISKTRFGKILSQSASRALGLDNICDFIIHNSNVNSGFQLTKEEYVTNSSYEKKVLTFFKKNVIPNHEVIFISYAHPILAL